MAKPQNQARIHGQLCAGCDMNPRSTPLRALNSHDHDAVREVYREAALNADPAFYSLAQRRAWAQQSDQLLRQQPGPGLVSCGIDGDVEAFGLRDRQDRIALLYCRPRSQRQGRCRQLLRALEQQARQEGCTSLRSEASFLSQPLFASEGWRVSWQEELLINGVLFRRFRMHKPLTAN